MHQNDAKPSAKSSTTPDNQNQNIFSLCWHQRKIFHFQFKYKSLGKLSHPFFFVLFTFYYSLLVVFVIKGSHLTGFGDQSLHNFHCKHFYNLIWRRFVCTIGTRRKLQEKKSQKLKRRTNYFITSNKHSEIVIEQTISGIIFLFQMTFFYFNKF